MIAAALGIAGLGRPAVQQFAQLLETGRGRKARSLGIDSLLLAQLADPDWSPGRSTSGRFVLFNGQFHNREAIRRQLGLAQGDDASLYAAALDRWGNAADMALGQRSDLQRRRCVLQQPRN